MCSELHAVAVRAYGQIRGGTSCRLYRSGQSWIVKIGVPHADEPLTVEQVAQHFHRARRADVESLLETLNALGHVTGTEDGAYVT